MIQEQHDESKLNKQGRMMKKLILPILAFFIVAYTFIGMMLPPPGTYVNNYKVGNDWSAIESIDKISDTSECTVDEEGVIIASGADPNICYDNINQSFKTLEIKLKLPSTKDFQIYVIFESVEGKEEMVHSFCSEGNDKIVVPYSKGKCKKITIGSCSKWFYVFKKFPFGVDKISLYSEDAIETQELFQHPNTTIYLLIGIIIGLIFAGVVALLDRKKMWSDRLPDKEKVLKFLKKVLGYAALLLISLVVALIAEYLISHFITGVRSDGSVFNKQRFVWIAGIVMLISSCIKHRNHIVKQPEKLFLCVLLILGMTMILAAPFGHICWDTDSHYRFILNASYIKTRYLTGSDYWICVNPSINGVYWPGNSALINNSHLQTFLNDSSFLYGFSNMRTTIAHIIPGIVMAQVRFAGFNAYWTGVIVKASILLFYAVICFVAMKKLKSGKMILAVVALFPTCIFLATNYSYDYWVTAFTLLGMAWFVGEMQQPEKMITTKDTIIMCGAFMLGSLPKLVYMPLMIIPLFMNRKKIDSKKKYYLTCLLAIVVAGLLFLIKAIIASTGTGDARGGSDVNSLEQVKFILSDPIGYATILLNFLKNYLSINNLRGYTVDFAYLNFGVGEYVILFLIFLTAFTDKNENDLEASNWKIRSITILLYFGLGAAIASALYISYTPVGSDTVAGCQYRYLIPLLYPVLSVLGYNKIKNPFNQKFYNYFVLLSSAAVNMACIYTVMLSRWN